MSPSRTSSCAQPEPLDGVLRVAEAADRVDVPVVVELVDSCWRSSAAGESTDWRDRGEVQHDANAGARATAARTRSIANAVTEE